MQARSTQLFGAPITPDTMVVQRDPNGLSADEQKRVVGRAVKIDAHGYPDLLSIAGAVPIINTLGLLPSSRERSTTAITYLYFPARYGFETRNELAHTFARPHPGGGRARRRDRRRPRADHAVRLDPGRAADRRRGDCRADCAPRRDQLPLAAAGPARALRRRTVVPGRHPSAGLDQRAQRHLDPQRDRAAAHRAAARDLHRLRDLLPLGPAPPVTGGRGAAARRARRRRPVHADDPGRGAHRRMRNCGSPRRAPRLHACVRPRPRVVGADRRRRLCHVRSRRDRAARAGALLAEPGAARHERAERDCRVARCASAPPSGRLRGRSRC